MHELEVKAKSAFTLLEIMIVMVIIGLMMTFVTPWLFKKEPSSEWPIVLTEVNNLVDFARQEAMANQKTFRLFFRKEKKDLDYIVVEKEEEDPEKPDHKIYEQVHSEYFQTRYVLPEKIKMDAVYLGKKELFSENKDNAYCYVIPNGLVQEVVVHLERKVEDGYQKGTFKMEPFLGMFEYHEGFARSP